MAIQYDFKSKQNPSTIKSDCIVVPVFCRKQGKGKKSRTLAQLHDAAKQLDESTQQALSRFIKTGDFSGKLAQTHIVYQLPGIKAPRVLLVGCGEQDNFDIQALNKATKAACKVIKDANIKQLCFYLADGFEDKAQAAMQIVIAQSDAFYTLEAYKSSDTSAQTLKQVSIALTDKAANTTIAAIKTAIGQGTAIAQGMKLTRDLANQPGNVCTPTYIARQARALAKNYSKISLKVLNEADMKKLGMGAFLSVSKGSDQPGKMIILQYKGAKHKSAAPVALVGKGVTFDSGGISLKPGAKMDEMKFDMSGAAGMLGTLKACAAMKLPINLVVVLAAAENMPSARASKPGDIVTSMSGKTIEVLNTDAEGRLVLCDALTYVGKYKPAVVIDSATLTGACIVALGHHICAVLSNDDQLAADLVQAGDNIHDKTWRLPMGDDYKKQLESAFADLGNIGGPAAGTITAACFLGEFTQDYRWAHLDIAGTAWTGKHATGRPVPLLSQYLINYANAKKA